MRENHRVLLRNLKKSYNDGKMFLINSRIHTMRENNG